MSCFSTKCNCGLVYNTNKKYTMCPSCGSVLNWDYDEYLPEDPVTNFAELPRDTERLIEWCDFTPEDYNRKRALECAAIFEACAILIRNKIK